MKSHRFDAGRLDVAVFASEAGRIEGAWPLAGMARLLDACHPHERPDAASRVEWRADGERRKPRAAEPATWLRLRVSACVMLTCQRCLGPTETPLEVDRWFGFVAGENQAAELDVDSDDDVLALTHTLDLHQLAEDELLLALPLVPRHAACPHPLVPPADDLAADAEAAPHPFAALAALKRGTH